MTGRGRERRATGVRLADGRVFRGKAVISNATRWDTFEKLMAQEEMPASERLFRCCPPASAAVQSVIASPAAAWVYLRPVRARSIAGSYAGEAAAPPVQRVPVHAQEKAIHPCRAAQCLRH